MNIEKIKFYCRRIYRLSLNYKKQEALVWKDLKKLHALENYPSGIFEKEKYIETPFEIYKGQRLVYFYIIAKNCYHCRVQVLENFPVDATSDIFILASHFNNLLPDGVVVVNTDNNCVEYQQKTKLLIPLLYTGELHAQIISHYNISKDIFAGFQRLIEENEAPAIIIADILKKKDTETS